MGLFSFVGDLWEDVWGGLGDLSGLFTDAVESIGSFTLGSLEALGGFALDIGEDVFGIVEDAADWFNEEVIKPATDGGWLLDESLKSNGVLAGLRNWSKMVWDDPIYFVATFLAVATQQYQLLPIISAVKTKSDGGTWGEAISAYAEAWIGQQLVGPVSEYVSGVEALQGFDPAAINAIATISGNTVAQGASYLIRGDSFEEGLKAGAIIGTADVAAGYIMGKIDGQFDTEFTQPDIVTDPATGVETFRRTAQGTIAKELKALPKVARDLIAGLVQAELSGQTVNSDTLNKIGAKALVTGAVVSDVAEKLNIGDSAYWAGEEGEKVLSAIVPSIQSTVSTVLIKGLSGESAAAFANNFVSAINSYGMEDLTGILVGEDGLLDPALDEITAFIDRMTGRQDEINAAAADVNNTRSSSEAAMAELQTISVELNGYIEEANNLVEIYNSNESSAKFGEAATEFTNAYARHEDDWDQESLAKINNYLEAPSSSIAAKRQAAAALRASGETITATAWDVEGLATDPSSPVWVGANSPTATNALYGSYRKPEGKYSTPAAYYQAVFEGQTYYNADTGETESYLSLDFLQTQLAQIATAQDKAVAYSQSAEERAATLQNTLADLQLANVQAQAVFDTAVALSYQDAEDLNGLLTSTGVFSTTVENITRVLAPDFDPEAYRTINNVSDDIGNMYEHYLYVGSKEGLFTSNETYEAQNDKVLAEIKDAVLSSIELNTGVKTGQLNEDDMRAIDGTIQSLVDTLGVDDLGVFDIAKLTTGALNKNGGFELTDAAFEVIFGASRSFENFVNSGGTDENFSEMIQRSNVAATFADDVTALDVANGTAVLGYGSNGMRQWVPASTDRFGKLLSYWDVTAGRVSAAAGSALVKLFDYEYRNLTGDFAGAFESYGLSVVDDIWEVAKDLKNQFAGEEWETIISPAINQGLSEGVDYTIDTMLDSITSAKNNVTGFISTTLDKAEDGTLDQTLFQAILDINYSAFEPLPETERWSVEAPEGLTGGIKFFDPNGVEKTRAEYEIAADNAATTAVKNRAGNLWNGALTGMQIPFDLTNSYLGLGINAEELPEENKFIAFNNKVIGLLEDSKTDAWKENVASMQEIIGSTPLATDDPDTFINEARWSAFKNIGGAYEEYPTEFLTELIGKEVGQEAIQIAISLGVSSVAKNPALIYAQSTATANKIANSFGFATDLALQIGESAGAEGASLYTTAYDMYTEQIKADQAAGGWRYAGASDGAIDRVARDMAFDRAVEHQAFAGTVTGLLYATAFAGAGVPSIGSFEKNFFGVNAAGEFTEGFTEYGRKIAADYDKWALANNKPLMAAGVDADGNLTNIFSETVGEYLEESLIANDAGKIYNSIDPTYDIDTNTYIAGALGAVLGGGTTAVLTSLGPTMQSDVPNNYYARPTKRFVADPANALAYQDPLTSLMLNYSPDVRNIVKDVSSGGDSEIQARQELTDLFIDTGIAFDNDNALDNLVNGIVNTAANDPFFSSSAGAIDVNTFFEDPDFGSFPLAAAGEQHYDVASNRTYTFFEGTSGGDGIVGRGWFQQSGFGDKTLQSSGAESGSMFLANKSYAAEQETHADEAVRWNEIVFATSRETGSLYSDDATTTGYSTAASTDFNQSDYGLAEGAFTGFYNPPPWAGGVTATGNAGDPDVNVKWGTLDDPTSFINFFYDRLESAYLEFDGPWKSHELGPGNLDTSGGIWRYDGQSVPSQSETLGTYESTRAVIPQSVIDTLPIWLFEGGVRAPENIKQRRTLNPEYNKLNQFGLDAPLITSNTDVFNYEPSFGLLYDAPGAEQTHKIYDASGTEFLIPARQGTTGSLLDEWSDVWTRNPDGTQPIYVFASGHVSGSDTPITGQRIAWGLITNGEDFYGRPGRWQQETFDIVNGEPIPRDAARYNNSYGRNELVFYGVGTDKPGYSDEVSTSGWYNYAGEKVAGSDTWSASKAQEWLQYGNLGTDYTYSQPSISDLGGDSSLGVPQGQYTTVEDARQAGKDYFGNMAFEDFPNTSPVESDWAKQKYTDRWGNVWAYTPSFWQRSRKSGQGKFVFGSLYIEKAGVGSPGIPDYIPIAENTRDTLYGLNISPLQYLATRVDQVYSEELNNEVLENIDLYNAQIMFLNAGWKPVQVNEYFARNADDLLSAINDGSLTFDQFKAQYYDNGTLQSYVRSEEKIRQKFAAVAETADVTYDADGNLVSVNPISYIPTQAQIDALSTEGKVSLSVADVMNDSMLTAAVTTVVDENTVSKTEAENAIKDYVESTGGVFNADDWTDEITELRTIISQEELTTTEYQRDEAGVLVLDADGNPIEVGQTVVQEGKTAAEILATDVATLVPDRYIGTNDVQTAFAAAGIDFSDNALLGSYQFEGSNVAARDTFFNELIDTGKTSSGAQEALQSAVDNFADRYTVTVEEAKEALRELGYRNVTDADVADIAGNYFNAGAFIRSLETSETNAYTGGYDLVTALNNQPEPELGDLVNNSQYIAANPTPPLEEVDADFTLEYLTEYAANNGYRNPSDVAAYLDTVDPQNVVELEAALTGLKDANPTLYETTRPLASYNAQEKFDLFVADNGYAPQQWDTGDDPAKTRLIAGGWTEAQADAWILENGGINAFNEVNFNQGGNLEESWRSQDVDSMAGWVVTEQDVIDRFQQLRDSGHIRADFVPTQEDLDYFSTTNRAGVPQAVWRDTFKSGLSTFKAWTPDGDGASTLSNAQRYQQNKIDNYIDQAKTYLTNNITPGIGVDNYSEDIFSNADYEGIIDLSKDSGQNQVLLQGFINDNTISWLDINLQLNVDLESQFIRLRDTDDWLVPWRAANLDPAGNAYADNNLTRAILEEYATKRGTVADIKELDAYKNFVAAENAKFTTVAEARQILLDAGYTNVNSMTDDQVRATGLVGDYGPLSEGDIARYQQLIDNGSLTQYDSRKVAFDRYRTFGESGGFFAKTNDEALADSVTWLAPRQYTLEQAEADLREELGFDAGVALTNAQKLVAEQQVDLTGAFGEQASIQGKLRTDNAVTTAEEAETYFRDVLGYGEGWIPLDEIQLELAGLFSEDTLSTRAASLADQTTVTAEEVKAALLAGITSTGGTNSNSVTQYGLTSSDIQNAYDSGALDQFTGFYWQDGKEGVAAELGKRLRDRLHEGTINDTEVRNYLADLGFDVGRGEDTQLPGLLQLGGSSRGFVDLTSNTTVQEYIDANEVTEQEAIDYLTSLGYQNVTAEDVAPFIGVNKVQDDLGTATATWQAENETQNQELARLQREATEQAFLDLGYTPTESEITNLNDNNAGIEAYVDPRQVTQAEAEAYFASLGYTPTTAEVAAYVGQGDSSFAASQESAVGTYVDPLLFDYAEAEQALSDAGFTSATDAEIRSLIVQAAENAELTGQSNVDTFLAPRQFTEAEAITALKAQGITEANPDFAALVAGLVVIDEGGADTQTTQQNLAVTNAAPYIITAEEAAAAFESAYAGYNLSGIDLSSFTGERSEEDLAQLVSAEVDATTITIDEARAALEASGFDLTGFTDENIQGLIGQKDTTQLASDITSFTAPYLIDLAEARAELDSVAGIDAYATDAQGNYLITDTQLQGLSLTGQFNAAELTNRVDLATVTEQEVLDAFGTNYVPNADEIALFTGLQSQEGLQDAVDNFTTDRFNTLIGNIAGLEETVGSLEARLNAAESLTGNLSDAINIVANDLDVEVDELKALITANTDKFTTDLQNAIGSPATDDAPATGIYAQLAGIDLTIEQLEARLTSAYIAADGDINAAIFSLSSLLGATESNLLTLIAANADAFGANLAAVIGSPATDTDPATGIYAQIEANEAAIADLETRLTEAFEAADGDINDAIGSLAQELNTTETELRQLIVDNATAFAGDLAAAIGTPSTEDAGATGLYAQIEANTALIADLETRLIAAFELADGDIYTAIDLVSSDLDTTKAELLQLIADNASAFAGDLATAIGTPSTENTLATGVYAQIEANEAAINDLETRLTTAFESADGDLQLAINAVSAQLGLTAAALTQLIIDNANAFEGNLANAIGTPAVADDPSTPDVDESQAATGLYGRVSDLESAIGSPATEDTPATGLYALIDALTLGGTDQAAVISTLQQAITTLQGQSETDPEAMAAIGSPATDTDPATGLYAYIDTSIGTANDRIDALAGDIGSPATEDTPATGLYDYIDTLIDGLPEGLTPQDVAAIVSTAIAGISETDPAAMAAIGSPATGDNPATGLYAYIGEIDSSLGDALNDIAQLQNDIGSPATGDDPATGLYAVIDALTLSGIDKDGVISQLQDLIGVPFILDDPSTPDVDETQYPTGLYQQVYFNNLNAAVYFDQLGSQLDNLDGIVNASISTVNDRIDALAGNIGAAATEDTPATGLYDYIDTLISGLPSSLTSTEVAAIVNNAIAGISETDPEAMAAIGSPATDADPATGLYAYIDTAIGDRISDVETDVGTIIDQIGTPAVADDPSTPDVDESQAATGFYLALEELLNQGANTDEAIAAFDSLIGSPAVADDPTTLDVDESQDATGIYKYMEDADANAATELTTALGGIYEFIGEQGSATDTEIKAIADLLGKPAAEVTQADYDYVSALLDPQNEAYYDPTLGIDYTAEQLLYDVNSDGVIDATDQQLIFGNLNLLPGVDPNQLTGKFQATGVYDILDTLADEQAQNDLNTQIAINTAIKQQNFYDLTRLLSEPGALQNTTTVTPPQPGQIEYMYDWESIFARPKQEALYMSPFAEGTGQFGGSSAETQSATQNIAPRAAATGGLIKNDTDELLDILGLGK